MLFLVRNAEDTLRSILNLFHGNDKEPYGDPEQALLYYATRLQRIEEYSVQLGRSALFLEAEKLLDDTPAVLDRLARWLQLGEPLNPSYRTFQYTGVAWGAIRLRISRRARSWRPNPTSRLYLRDEHFPRT